MFNPIFSFILHNEYQGLCAFLANQANHHFINSDNDNNDFVSLLKLSNNNRPKFPIHIAASKDYKFAKLLIDYGAYATVESANTNKTPLHIACSSSSSVETVKLLIRKGCSPFDKDSSGNTALQYAKNHNNQAVVQFLEKYCEYEKYFVSTESFGEFTKLLREEGKYLIQKKQNNPIIIIPKLLKRFEPLQTKERIQKYLETNNQKITVDRAFKLLFNLDMLELQDVGIATELTNLTTAFIVLVYLKEVVGKSINTTEHGLNKTMIKHGIDCTFYSLKKKSNHIVKLIQSKYDNELQTKCHFDVAIRKYIELFVCIDMDVNKKTKFITQRMVNDVLLCKEMSVSLPDEPLGENSKYVICSDAPLASGGYGTIYKCFNVNSSRFVACKLLDKNIHNELYYDEEEKKKNFKREKELTNLKHPNIISLLDFGTTQNPKNPKEESLYIATTFANGGSLESTLERCINIIPLNLTLEWMIQLCYGIFYLHTNNKIHRDIKPKNIVIVYGDHLSYKSMIESELLHGITPNSTLKIIDFGTVRNDEPGNNTSGVGTGKFKANEVNDSQDYSKPADIYSLGITFQKMLDASIGDEEELSNSISKQIIEMIKMEPSERPKIRDVLENLEEIKTGTF